MINLGSLEVQEPKFAIPELDHRRGNRIEVTLLWNVRTNDVFVAVAERDGGRFEFAVHPAEALKHSTIPMPMPRRSPAITLAT